MRSRLLDPRLGLFIPASLRVTNLTTRQIQMRGTQKVDGGVDLWITVIRDEGRKLVISLKSVRTGRSYGSSWPTLPFVP